MQLESQFDTHRPMAVRVGHIPPQLQSGEAGCGPIATTAHPHRTSFSAEIQPLEYLHPRSLTAKRESERLVTVADQHTAEALAAIERLEQTHEAQASTIATLQAELERHRTATTAAQTALATATAQAQTAEQRVAHLTSELAQARSELTAQAKIVGEAEALRKQVAELQRMIERMGERGTK